jgi:hypothetical protein
MWYIRKMFLVCPEIFFWDAPPPGGQHLREKILDAFFIRKVPHKAKPPSNILEASYAPESGS